MGIFNRKIEERKEKKYLTNTFKLMNGYVPSYITFKGGLYEMALTRSCIDKIATQCSKLNPALTGGRNYKKIKTILENKPNRLMTTQQFIYRLVSILLVENNAFIVPIYSSNAGTEIVGFYPVRSNGARIVTLNNTEYLVYQINNKEYSIELDRAGILRRHYYKKEYFGEDNSVMNSTMDLISIQEQGIKEGIKASGFIRFLARLGVVQNTESLKSEQKRLREDQLSIENSGGVLIFDNKYADIQQVNSKPILVDKDQMEIINKNVFDYFHMSEEILQNKASEDSYNMFYEDVIEPIAIQISQVLTNIIIKEEDVAKGYQITLDSTKLQFISNSTKLQVAQQLFDRGILNTNQVNDIFNLPHVEDGDKRYIRKEYTEVKNLDKELIEDGNEETQSKDEGNINREEANKKEN